MFFIINLFLIFNLISLFSMKKDPNITGKTFKYKIFKSNEEIIKETKYEINNDLNQIENNINKMKQSNQKFDKSIKNLAETTNENLALKKQLEILQNPSYFKKLEIFFKNCFGCL